MLLFRGQNKDTPFEPTSSRLSQLGGDNGAVYFMGFERRNAAVPYALTNYQNFENNDSFDEESEWVDEGVFYKCSYKDSNPTMLNDISSSDLTLSLSQVFDKIRGIDDTIFTNREEFIEFCHSKASALDVIDEINDIRNDYELTKKDFDDLISPILDECGTSIAVAVENCEVLNCEYLVYRTSDVSILNKVPVYKKDIKRQPLKERQKMTIDEINKSDKKYVDTTVLGR